MTGQDRTVQYIPRSTPKTDFETCSKSLVSGALLPEIRSIGTNPKLHWICAGCNMLRAYLHSILFSRISQIAAKESDSISV